MAPLSNPVIVGRILEVFRRYGWDSALERLRDEIAATREPEARNTLRLYAGWMAAERGQHRAAEEFLRDASEDPRYQGWSTLARAFVEMREHRFDEADRALAEAERLADADDTDLLAAVSHLRGANYFHAGRTGQAMAPLRRALGLVGKDHFMTGRVLDTFGMVYAGRDNVHAAEEFYRQAIMFKESWNDQAGLALSYGNLGRLYLDWGDLDAAWNNFAEDRRIAERNHDDRGVAQMDDHLGRVAIERGLRAQAEGQTAKARNHWTEAAELLDHAVTAAERGGLTVAEAYARKDRAHLALLQGDLDRAEALARRAEEIFTSIEFPEGLAHVQRVQGMVLRARGQLEDAARVLRGSLAVFERVEERAEQARTQWELARVKRDGPTPRILVVEDYTIALQLAEQSRRGHLVGAIERELAELDPKALGERTFHRVRGLGVDADTASLITGERKMATVLFLDIKESSNYGRETDPAVVMRTINQMMFEMVDPLRNRDGHVIGYRGDGFLALFRGQDHARRAVDAALELFQSLRLFNEPRELLGMPALEARIGISTGEMYLGNVGTYDKLDYTAVGQAVNLGARLEAAAQPGLPCISATTHDMIGSRYRFAENNPRHEDLKGVGRHAIWDVCGKS